jgi:hypothetical protein
MLIRNCAGGLVFQGDRVLLTRDEKGNWGFPKDVVRHGKLSHETALEKVWRATGIKAEIISAAGLTNYEIFSVTKQKPMCDKTTWYIMKSLDGSLGIDSEEGLSGGGFFNIEEAMKIIKHNQDRALLRLTHSKYRDLVELEAV